ncbi:unnamed protein product [Rotaria sp. Silwood1]|nr:unnamed protein product [Rotaria sp. Silwood1]CAF1002281.1 unnamed protein product [Rotaria sp. Silwood1]CAF3396675.1 unnamed protein product [Rotaria sp. Silwood1]CAF3420886.1 unnamed protein product [Rotaria sp. Silwood1]CAF3429588.1 unnamed protein product [Rotaria sp. Silwood1]
MVPLNKMNNQQPLNNSKNFVRRRPMSNGRNDNIFDVKYKVLLLGDTLVGKTSLQRFIGGKEFRPDIGSTIGIDFINKIIPVEKSKINLQIWDTAGQRNFRTIGKNYYASTKAFVLIYDVTNEESFNLIQQFNQLIEQTGLDMERRYLVANKIDLAQNRIVDEETGRRFALRNSMVYFETSCKTGENVFELVEQIASDLVRQHDSKILEFHKPVKENFAFNYHTSPIINHEIHDRPTEKIKKPKKKRNIFSSLSYESIDKNYRFNFRRFILCCKPS